MTLPRIALFCFLAVQEMWCTGACAQVPLPIEEALKTRSFAEESPLAISPDGKWIAYVLHDDERTSALPQASVEAGMPRRAYGDQLWITNLETRKSQRLLDDAVASWDPTWSPDASRLAFLSDREGTGEARLWVWGPYQGAPKMVSRLSIKNRYPMNRMMWTPDSRSIVLTVVPQNESTAANLSWGPTPPTRTTAAMEKGSSVRVRDAGIQSGGDGPAISPMFDLDTAYRRDLAVVEVSTGQASTLVSGGRIGWYSVSPDGSRVAYANPKRFDRPGSPQRVYDLALISLVNRRVQLLCHDLLLDDAFSWSPDGKIISFGAYDGRSGYIYYTVPGNGGEPREIARLPYHSYAGGFRWMPLWDSSNQNVYFLLGGALWRVDVLTGHADQFAQIPGCTILERISQSMGRLWMVDGGKATVVIARDDRHKREGFYKINLATGESTALHEETACFHCKMSNDVDSYDVAVSADGNRIVFIVEDAERSPNLFFSDSAFRDPKRVGNLNPQFDRYEMGSVRLIDWLSEDGDQLRGALLLPPRFKPGQKLPLLVWVYPGLYLSNDFVRFGLGEFPGPFNLQLFATRGYAILAPDSPAASADRFANLAKSILPGVNRVIEMGIADPARIGVMGHSQGGYATLALIVQTHLFKAAMAADGWGDYSAYYGLMQADGAGYQYGQAESQLGGPPWEYPNRYIQSSPVFYLDRVETPLLIVQGSEDIAHPSFLADEVFVGLRRLGKRVSYAKYLGEGHSPRDWSFANQLDLADRVIGWFDEYLKRN